MVNNSPDPVMLVKRRRLPEGLGFLLRASLAFAVVLLCAGCAGCVGTVGEVPSADRSDAASEVVPEIAAALEGSRVEYVDGGDGIPIPVRVFGEAESGVPVLMLHGLQSHSVWFAQSARFMADQGFPVYAIDRRGSGMSEALRGDCEDFHQWSADIHAVALYAMKQHRVSKVNVLGHCFGAIPATVYACEYAGEVASLILPTPGIYTHSDLSFGQKIRILWNTMTGGRSYLPVPLEAGEFTEISKYQAFIRDDPAALRAATTSFYYEVHRARRYIQRNADRVTMPVFMAFAANDRICDNQRNRRFFEMIPAEQKKLVIYGASRHILEFGREREAFFADLGEWLTEAGMQEPWPE